MDGEPQPAPVQPVHAVLHEPPGSLEHLAGPQQPRRGRPRREEPLKPSHHQGDPPVPVSGCSLGGWEVMDRTPSAGG